MYYIDKPFHATFLLDAYVFNFSKKYNGPYKSLKV